MSAHPRTRPRDASGGLRGGPRMALWMGVDVGGKRKGFDAALVDDSRLLRLEGGLSCDAVIELVRTCRPALVGIDSPRRCAPDGHGSRTGERQLARSICGIRWTPERSRVELDPYYAWVREGLALFDALSELEADAIEVFPRPRGRAGRGRGAGGSERRGAGGALTSWAWRACRDAPTRINATPSPRPSPLACTRTERPRRSERSSSRGCRACGRARERPTGLVSDLRDVHGHPARR